MLVEKLETGLFLIIAPELFIPGRLLPAPRSPMLLVAKIIPTLPIFGLSDDKSYKVVCNFGFEPPPIVYFPLRLEI